MFKTLAKAQENQIKWMDTNDSIDTQLQESPIEAHDIAFDIFCYRYGLEEKDQLKMSEIAKRYGL